MWCLMFVNFRKTKNTLNSNDLVIKGMYKRRRLAMASIAMIQNKKHVLQVVK
mgnify:CR=1 FL=1